MKTKTIFGIFMLLLLAFVGILSEYLCPDVTHITASGALAAAMLFNAANLSSWRQRVDAFITSKGLNPANYPIEWRKIVTEVTVTQSTLFRFLLKEDPNATKDRQQRLGLNDAFFGFAGRFAILDVTLATPYNSVPSTSAIIAAHNVFYETGTLRLGSGNVEVWSRQPLSQYKYNPNSQTAISDNDGISLCYPSPVLSGRNDLQFVLDIANPDTITHATPNTNAYVLQYNFFGFNVVGLAKDIETGTF